MSSTDQKVDWKKSEKLFRRFATMTEMEELNLMQKFKQKQLLHLSHVS